MPEFNIIARYTPASEANWIIVEVPKDFNNKNTGAQND